MGRAENAIIITVFARLIYFRRGDFSVDSRIRLICG